MSLEDPLQIEPEFPARERSYSGVRLRSPAFDDGRTEEAGVKRPPLEILLELTRLLTGERSLEAALQSTTDATLELIDCDHASLRLFDDERRNLVSIARSGVGASEVPAVFRAGQGVLGKVADTGKSALIADASKDERFAKREVGFELRSLVAVPMVSGGRVVGVLSASSPELGHFDERSRDLLQLLANCAAPAIETARLGRLAVTDELTGAYNYRYRESRMCDEVSRAERYGDQFSVLMMDLDHFKRVNDRLGHPVGDEVLKAFVARVREEVRDPDVIIRRGGEEFMLLMPATDSLEARTVAERIRASLCDTPPGLPSGGAVPVTVSVGVATWQRGEGVDALEARADRALYRAKELGRNRIQTS